MYSTDQYKVSVLLEKAKITLEMLGWGQYQSWDIKDGKPCNFCMSGAVNHVLDEDMREQEWKQKCQSKQYRTAINILSEVIGDKENWSSQVVVRYNDEDGRTKEEVLGVFDRAIILAKAKEANE